VPTVDEIDMDDVVSGRHHPGAPRPRQRAGRGAARPQDKTSNTERSLRLNLIAIVALAFVAAPAHACRCPQRGLEAYLAAADIVFLGRVLSLRTEDGPPQMRRATFHVQEAPYKGDPSSIERFVTPVSSSLCGSVLESDRLYLVFATRDTDDVSTARFDTCGGTRSFDPKGSEGVMGFADVDAREVLPRLTRLRRISQAPAAAAPPSGPRLPLPGDPNAELIGLLELPSILNLDEPGSSSPPPRLPPQAIPVYSMPDASSAEVGRILKPADVSTREFDYERKAVVVRERRAGWYRIALAGGKLGWLRAEVVGPFHPFAEMIVNRLSYLTAAWDGYVWPEPGAGYPIEHTPWRSSERQEQPAEVLSTEDIGGTLWLQVRVLSASPCEGGTPKVLLGGWIPAYTPEGRVTTWFYPRGC
jgi:hypothetical protein